MDRGQDRGYRAATPWATTAAPSPHIGAQLTWHLPTRDLSTSNRLNGNFPAFVNGFTFSGNGTTYYNAHQPEYYMNWWCDNQSPDVFVAVNHNCLDLNGYFEMITEIPSVDGSPTVNYLGLWATGGTNNYTVYFDQSVCDALYVGQSANLSPSNLVPLIFPMPTSSSIVYSPVVCAVQFGSNSFQPNSDQSWGFRQSDIVGYPNNMLYQKVYMGTFQLNDLWNGSQHWIELMNYYYTQGANGPCISQLYGGASNPWVETYPPTWACVTGLEAYWMVDIGYPTLNGMVAWTPGLMPDGSLDTQPWTPSYTPYSAWIYDTYWNGWGNANYGAPYGWGTPNPTFAFVTDQCSFSSLPSDLTNLQCH